MNKPEIEIVRKLLDYSSPCQFVNPREWNFKRDMAYLILDREENRIDRRYFESQICLVKREMEKAKLKHEKPN
jgi:hypothetical protein